MSKEVSQICQESAPEKEDISETLLWHWKSCSLNLVFSEIREANCYSGWAVLLKKKPKTFLHTFIKFMLQVTNFVLLWNDNKFQNLTRKYCPALFPNLATVRNENSPRKVELSVLI